MKTEFGLNRTRRRKPPIKTVAILLLLYLISAPEAKAAAADYRVTGTFTLTAAGGRLDWSPDGQWIYYDHREDDHYYDVHRIHPDGSGDVCLTCDHPDLPNRHQGQPEMHPSGRWLLFQGEKSSHWEETGEYNPCNPGGGYYNDLYLMDLESDPPYDVHRLTDVRSGIPPGGSLHPHFNHDGTRLLWADLEGIGGRFGNWRLAVAEFETETAPHLKNHSYYQPGDNPLWFESHGWGPDDSWIYFSAAPISGTDDFAADICRMDFSHPEVALRLTRTSGSGGEAAEWDEHAHLSPLNDAFSWMSSNGYGIHPEDPNWRGWITSDIWLMNPDGSGQKQVTFFNLTGHEEHIPGEVVCADNSWSPDGQRLAVTVFLRGFNQSHIKIISFSRRPLLDSGDYDGDGTSDIAVFRKDSGLWAIRKITRVFYGGSGDNPASADYDGDGTAEIGIFRKNSGLWALRNLTRFCFGSTSDIAVPGDYDGDGTTEAGIFRPAAGLWALRGVTRLSFGTGEDQPLPGDYDGDGTTDPGLFRAGSGLWALKGISRVYFGEGGDTPLPGDYNSDGTGEIGIFRASCGLWALGGITRVNFGSSSDLPAPADYDGDSIDDIAIFRESAGLWACPGSTRVYFGAAGDIPATR